MLKKQIELSSIKITMNLIEDKISDFGETLSMNTRVAIRLSYLKSCDLRLP